MGQMVHNALDGACRVRAVLERARERAGGGFSLVGEARWFADGNVVHGNL